MKTVSFDPLFAERVISKESDHILVRLVQNVRTTYVSADMVIPGLNDSGDQEYTSERSVLLRVTNPNIVRLRKEENILTKTTELLRSAEKTSGMLYRIRAEYSLSPILDDGLRSAIAAGRTTIEKLTDSQRICGQDGTPALYEGYEQFRRLTLTRVEPEVGSTDVDHREEDLALLS